MDEENYDEKRNVNDLYDFTDYPDQDSPTKKDELLGGIHRRRKTYRRKIHRKKTHKRKTHKRKSRKYHKK